MAVDAFVKPLLALPLFRGLKPLQITEIVRRADRVIFKPGEFIVREDQVGDAAFIVVSGPCVRISSQEPGNAGEAVPEGAMIAELAMLVETVHSSTVIARGSVKALRIAREDIHELMAEEPALAEHFSAQILMRLKKLAEELRAIDNALADITSFNAAGARMAVQLSTERMVLN